MIRVFRAVQAAGSLVGLQGCEPRTFCWLAQQPWREAIFQTWWSHTPTENMNTYHHIFPSSLQENIEMWQSWFTLHHWAYHRPSSHQQFSSECHLCQKAQIGSDLSRCDECSHLYRDNLRQMCWFRDLGCNSLSGSQRHFHSAFKTESQHK